MHLCCLSLPLCPRLHIQVCTNIMHVLSLNMCCGRSALMSQCTQVVRPPYLPEHVYVSAPRTRMDPQGRPNSLVTMFILLRSSRSS